jgi:hypothetical protein
VFSDFKMGDLSFNYTNGGYAVRNNSVLGLDEYDSDEALAAVELFMDYPDWLLKFASLCCALFMLAGIPGNLITIIALARCKKVRITNTPFLRIK